VRLNRCALGTGPALVRIGTSVAFLMILGTAVLTVAGKSRAVSGFEGSPSREFFSSDLSPARRGEHAISMYGQLPLAFEPNQGQSDSRVKFLARGAGYGLFLTSQEVVLSLHPKRTPEKNDSADRASVLRMSFANANPEPPLSGVNLLPGKSNYFLGSNPAKWRRNIPQFAGVRYGSVYSGVDLVYYGNQGHLEYDFDVAPGADPAQIGLRLQGADGVRLNGDGSLSLVMPSGEIRLEAPRVYQVYGKEQHSVSGRYVVRAANEIGFEIGTYDRTRSLIIDPVLTYSTYLGGSLAESCSAITGLSFTPGCPAIAVDSSSSVYVAGSTQSTDFPVTSGAYQTALATGATANVFVAKLNPTGNALVFATYLGGTGLDYSAGVAVDAASDVFVAGTTSSGDFPTFNGYQDTRKTAGNHVFVTELDSQGAVLKYSTYLSGSKVDTASGLALDVGGNAYVTGTTTSTDFPTTLGAIQTTSKADNQFFLSKISATDTGTASLAYSTYFGGSNPSTGEAVGGGIAVDVSSDVYITGGTNFLDFPILNAYQGCLNSAPSTTTCPTSSTPLDVFVAKINPAAATGAQLLYSTFLGGSADDIGYGIAVDSSFNAYVTGSTTSTDFSFTSPSGTTVFQAANGGGTDSFIAKLGNLTITSGSTSGTVPLSYFSYLGGSGTDVGTAITADSIGGGRITGWTDSSNFPSVNNPVQAGPGGGVDAFAARIDTTATTNTAIGHYSTYLGGSGTDMGTGIAVDTQGASYVAGETSSTNFTTAAPLQAALSGASDAFVSKLGPVLNLTVTATASPSPVGVGNPVTFTYTITNNGDFTSGLTFTDNLPTSGAASFSSATASPGTCSGATGATVVCSIGSLNAGATATVSVILTPVAPLVPATVPVILGNTGTLTVSGTAYSVVPSPPASTTVNDYNVAVAPATATVPAGVPASYTATVTPTGNIPDAVTLSCSSGLPTGATCTIGTNQGNNQIPNLSNGAQSRVVVINTTQRVTTTTSLWRRGLTYALWLPISGITLLGVGIGRNSRGRKALSRCALAGLFLGFSLLLLFQAGCGSSSSKTTTTGTPAGTYNVTVSATSGTATRSYAVTLVVQ